LVVLVEPGVVFTRLLAIAVSAVLPGDLGSDPRAWMARTRDDIWDHLA
jgi:hypothetical protein